jgi:hypothetical protein
MTSLNRTPPKAESAGSRRPLTGTALVVLLLLLAGCGAEGPVRLPVEGAVAVDGRMLPAGVIRFIPSGDTKGPSAVATIRDGFYELPAEEGPVLGTQRVEIEAIDHLGFALDDEAAYVRHIERGRRGMPPNPIPETYNRRSTLTVTVGEDGRQKFNFDIETEPAVTARR